MGFQGDHAEVERLRQDLAIDPLTFALAPELRRSAWYVLLGCLLAAALIWWLRDLLPPRGLVGQVVVLSVLGAIALAAVAALRWRVRADGHGVARRRLLGWDTWPWEVFAEGRVREGDLPDDFVMPERPPWGRRLSLGLLADDQRDMLSRIIRRSWVRPSGPEPPPELAIRFPFRRRARFHHEGIDLAGRSEGRRYAWQDVRLLRIRRFGRQRRDFVELELVLPDQVVSLRVGHQHGRGVPSWSGADGMPTPGAEVVAGVLLRHVPRDRVRVTALNEPPESREEWEDRMARLDRGGRELAQLRWIILAGGVLLLPLSLSEIGRGWLAVLKLLGLSAVSWGLFWAVFRHLQRGHRATVEELRNQMPAGGTGTRPTDFAVEEPRSWDGVSA